MSYFFWRTMYVYNNQLQIVFSRPIVSCCMWSIGLSRDKTRMYSRIVYYLYITKSLASSILNIHDIISREDCFKLMFSPHIYCKKVLLQFLFTTKFKVKTSFFTCVFVVSFFICKFYNICT